jgi:CheY-like chemotaxis protein
MTAEVLAKAFDPFFTTKDIGHGTGLGLSQVYGFAKQSRGHVKIYSEVGEGTTIKLYLPRAHTAPVDAESDTEYAGAGSRGETVLVVEDDVDVRAYSCETLAELGYTVLSAENGAAGLRLLDTYPEIRVLFTDIGLPGGMNGRQLSEEAPGVELITKPFAQATLATRLRDIIDAKYVPGRILLVEDDVMIRMLATEYLEEGGFKVDAAGSATEAMNKLRLIPGGVDGVIIDIGLPDRGGDALVAEIRAIYPSLPIVLASGHSVATLCERFKAQERVAFASKPYTAQSLLGALRTLGLVPASPGL